MGAIAPGRAQVVAAEVKAVGSQQRFGALVLEGRPLELEEQEEGLGLGGALLHELELGPALGVRGVGGEAQRDVGAGAADQLVDGLELDHGFAKPVGMELRQSAGVALRERARALGRLVEELGDGGRTEKLGEVPLGGQQLGVREVIGGG